MSDNPPWVWVLEAFLDGIFRTSWPLPGITDDWMREQLAIAELKGDLWVAPGKLAEYLLDRFVPATSVSDYDEFLLGREQIPYDEQ